MRTMRLVHSVFMHKNRRAATAGWQQIEVAAASLSSDSSHAKSILTCPGHDRSKHQCPPACSSREDICISIAKEQLHDLQAVTGGSGLAGFHDRNARHTSCSGAMLSFCQAQSWSMQHIANEEMLTQGTAIRNILVQIITSACTVPAKNAYS